MVLTLLKTLVRGKKIHFQTRTKYTSIRAYLIKSNHYLQPLVFPLTMNSSVITVIFVILKLTIKTVILEMLLSFTISAMYQRMT